MQRLALGPIALATTAAFSACQMMAFVLYPYFAESMRLPLTHVITSFAVGSFLFLWGSPYWARRSETWGLRAVLGIGLGGLFLAQLALLGLMTFAMASWLTTLLLWSSRILYGLTASAIVPVSQMIMAHDNAKGMPMKAMTRHSMSLQVGRLAGPFLIAFGLLFSAITPLWLCLGLLLGLGLILLRGSDLTPRRHPSPRSLWHWPASTQSRYLIGMAFGVTCLVGILQSSLTRHVQINFGLAASEAAPLTLRFLLASSLLTLGVQVFVQAKIKTPWQGTFPVGAVCLVISTFVLWLASSPHELWWALPLFAAGLALLTPSYTAALNANETDTTGAAAGLLSVAHTLGYTVGGLLTAGLLALGISPLGAAWLVALILLTLVLPLKSEAKLNLQPYKKDHR